MTLKTTGFETSVISRITTQYPNLAVYDSEVPEDSDIQYTNGLFSPFVVVYFGGPIRAARDRGIVSTRNDSTILYCTLEVYAPRSDTARAVRDNLVDLLTGFIPPDCGEMSLEGGFSSSRASTTVRPTQYIRSLAFTTRGNLSTPGIG